MKVQQLLERHDLIESSLKMSTDNLEGAWGINFEKKGDQVQKILDEGSESVLEIVASIENLR